MDIRGLGIAVAGELIFKGLDSKLEDKIFYTE